MLRSNLGSLQLDNPVLSASGTFGSGWEGRQFSDLGMVGGLVSKTVTLVPWHGNPPPRIHETPSGMLNSIGLENKGADYFLRESLPRMHELARGGRRDGRHGPRVIVNIGGESVDDFVQMAERFCAAGVDALEVNLSCPNVQGGKLPFSTDPRQSEQAMRAVKAVATVPVFAKLSPNVTDIVEIAKGAVQGGADGLTAINTLIGMAVDWRQRRPILGKGIGGLSGPAIKPVALRMVAQLAKAFPSMPILAVGGVHSADCVLEFVCAGASAVQVGTAMFSDPTLMVRMVGELEQRLRSEGTTIRELRGSMHRDGAVVRDRAPEVRNPAANTADVGPKATPARQGEGAR